MAILIYIPTSSVWEFKLLYVFSNLKKHAYEAVWASLVAQW